MTTPPQPPPYPQHPQQGPYAQPGTYAQQPGPHIQPGPYAQSQQGGWGGQPMWIPPAPSKKNRGRTVAIVIASIVGGLLLLGFVASLVGNLSDESFPEPDYKLTLQKSLVDGKYTLAQDMSDEAAKTVDGDGPNEHDVTPVAGQYTAASDSAPGSLVISGLSGKIKDPEHSRASMLKGVEDGDGAAVVVPAKTITPKGGTEEVRCEVLTVTKNGQTVPFPVCAWADNGTAATVAEVTAESTTGDPESIDLEALAVTTDKIRSEMRVSLK